MTAIRIPFTKLSGAGNEFILVENLEHRLASLKGQWPAVSRMVCDATQGLGADGLLVIEPSKRAALRMRIFNPDGSEPSMCGNGVRCLAFYAHRHGLAGRRFTIETTAGIQHAQVQGPGDVRIEMGIPRLRACLRDFTLLGAATRHADVIDSGVPHVVCWVDDVKRLDVQRLGRRVRLHRRFRPDGANVDFLELEETRAWEDARRGVWRCRARLKMRTYERGVERETQACGTGAVAAACAFAHTVVPARGLGRRPMLEWFEVEVRVPGGVLRVDLGATSRQHAARRVLTRASLEGPARHVCRGVLSWNGRAER